MPDLLDEQEADLYWVSNDGVRHKHRVRCAVLQTEANAEPPPVTVVTQDGQEVPLLHPVVVHNVVNQTVTLRLPESFRSRAYTALSWWMMCMQLSPRDVIPEYAMRPRLSFFHLTESEETRASVPMVDIAELERVVDSVHDTQTTTARTEADTVRDAPSPRRRAEGPPPTTPGGHVDPFARPATMDIAASAAPPKRTRPLESSKVATFADSSWVEEESQASIRTQTSLPDAGEEEGGLSLANVSPNGEATITRRKPVNTDPASTREAPAPQVPVDEATVLPSEDLLASPASSPIVVARGSRAPEPVPPTPGRDEAATKVSRRPSLMEQEPENLAADPEPWEPSQEELSDSMISNTPTVSRRAEPSSLADIRGSSQRAVTAVRQIIGNGVSLSPEYEQPAAPPVAVSAWEATDLPWFFEASLEHQRCSLAFLWPRHSARLLDQGGQVNFYLQLHRMPTYPLLAILLTFQNADGELQDTLVCPFDLEEPQALIFMDFLMQDFSLQIFLCDENYQAYRDLQVQLPLEPNVEYLLQQARQYKQTVEPGLRNIAQAISRYQREDYDRLGQMSHNFSHDSFSDIKSPARARLASGIIAYWSEPEQYDYLIAIKSFPLDYFHSIQNRVLQACLEFGIALPMPLMGLAVEHGLGESIPDLLRRMLASFAEVNLNLRQENDLDPWDNLENWQQLFDMCDQVGVEIDDDIEELAQRAQRQFEAESAQAQEGEGEIIEIVEDFQDMDPRDLLDMLQEPDNRLEAALALCDIADPSYVDHAASVFTEINNREDAILFADAFTQFGEEAEPLLVSWLHLPRRLHREAAMLALGTMRASSAVDAILKRLRSGEEWETAAEALGRMGEAAIPALGQELHNKNWLIRLRAVKALYKINTPQSRAMIEQLREDSNEVVKAEVIALLGS